MANIAPAHEDFRIEHRTKTRTRLVMGVFADLRRAGNAMLSLEERGFPPEEIIMRLSKEAQNVLEGRRAFRDQRGRTYVARDKVYLQRARKTLAGLGVGSATGILLGLFAGLLTAAGEPALVGVLGATIDAHVAALWAAIGMCAIAGAVTGAIIGALLFEYRAKDYHGCLATDGVLVGVTVHDDTEADAIEEELSQQGAEVVRAA